MSLPVDERIEADFEVDAKGLSCPMPIVRTKKQFDEMKPGQVVAVYATDVASVADLQGWAKSTRNQYIGTLENDGVYIHYLRKADPSESKEETVYPHVISNEALIQIVEAKDTDAIILDVREPAEYAFNRIPGAKSIPFGELEARLDELEIDATIYVICRTGRRSDLAAKLLAERGYKNVKNIKPGMSDWTGPIEGGKSHG